MAVSLNGNALITVEELKTFLNNDNITSKVASVTDVSYQNTLINQASDFIQRFCNRIFISAIYTQEAYNGTGSFYLYLRQFPITSATITLVAWDTFSNVVLNTFLINTDYLIVDANSGTIWKRTLFIKGINNYRVTYTAGYTKDGTGTIVPYDLKNACAALAGMQYSNAGKSGIASEKIGAYAVTYSKPDAANNITYKGFPIPSEIAGIIQQYRRFNV